MRIARRCIIYILDTVWNSAPIPAIIRTYASFRCGEGKALATSKQKPVNSLINYCRVTVEITKASYAITNRRIQFR